MFLLDVFSQNQLMEVKSHTNDVTGGGVSWSVMNVSPAAGDQTSKYIDQFSQHINDFCFYVL